MEASVAPSRTSHLFVIVRASFEACDFATSEPGSYLELKALDAIFRLAIDRVRVGQFERTQRGNPSDADTHRIAQIAEVDLLVLVNQVASR
jgi:hypothetical protein